jgi:ATP-dependent DNA helicase RecG
MSDFLKNFLFTTVASLDGVGQKRAALYKNLKIDSVRDLLLWLPERIIEKTINPTPMQLQSGMHVILDVVVDYAEIPNSTKAPCTIMCTASSGFDIEILFFHYQKAQLLKQFEQGKALVIDGVINISHGIRRIVHPNAVVTPDERFKIFSIEPVYPATKGLTSKMIALTIRKALKNMPQVDEWLPAETMQQHAWPSFKKCLEILHTPKDKKDVTRRITARQRLAFDEMLAHQFSLSALRLKNKVQMRSPFSFNGALKEQMLSIIPFALTQCQQQAIKEIEADLKANHKTVRLLQGDVGAGKTLVALTVMLDVVESGHQAVMMVPTEILAQQHFNNIRKLTDSIGVEVCLLLGKMSVMEKRRTLDKISSGEGQIIIGTHALIQQDVQYADLRFAVIDEQHRFGVLQRQALLHKANQADLLMMTATPIPRTLEMAMYGDMSVSYLKTKPANRKEIITSIISYKKVDELQQAIVQKIKQGQKIYWICPLISQNETMDLTYIEHRFATLNNLISGKVGCIHSKIKQVERDEIMQKFVQGELQILVATTVIEVGVDVTDATIMVIENAERFGLAQLHQLRGRVGRGDQHSFCILIYGKAYGSTSQERLNVMKLSNDGFMIAEKDLQLRSAGDVVGTKQSGDLEFKIFDFQHDKDIVTQAFTMAKILQPHPMLQMLFSKVL